MLYKPKLLKLKGNIKIGGGEEIKFGMIRLGFLSGPVSVPSYSVVGNGSHVVVKITGVWRNADDDVIEY